MQTSQDFSGIFFEKTLESTRIKGGKKTKVNAHEHPSPFFAFGEGEKYVCQRGIFPLVDSPEGSGTA